MRDDDKTTKPEQAPSERHWLENLGRLDLAHKPERLAIMAALLRHIGSQQKALDTCREFIADRMSPEEKCDPVARVRYLTRGKGLDLVLDYVAARVTQIPDMEGSRAMAMAHTLELGHEGLRALSALVHLAGGDEMAELSGHLKAMSEEAKQAADGWRVQQPATEEPNAEKRLALAFIPDGEYGEPGK